METTPKIKNHFTIEKFRTSYSGGGMEEARALFEIANQLRLQNYIELLKLTNIDGLNTLNVKELIEELVAQ
jgi:hypothetical protein